MLSSVLIPLALLCGFLCSAFGAPTAAALPGAALARCPGDCDDSGAVTVDELVMGVGITLGTQPLGTCPAFDADGDSVVVITELILAVNAALQDCPGGGETPTPTATGVPTITPTPEPVPTWSEAFDASTAGWMMSGWGPGDGTLWVVGGTNEHGRLFHFDRASWTEVDPGVSVPLLNWVHGTSGTDVFVGGNGGTILHFDGNGWTRQTTPVSLPVWGVFAVSSTDVWAVGGDDSSSNLPFVMRYDGTVWTHLDVPPLLRPRVAAFFKVWASGPNDVYAVGQNGAALHYDGQTFTELFLGVSQDLIGVWGTGPDNVLIAGGRTVAELVHFNGTSWRHVSSPYPGLNGVWMRRTDVAHVVGVSGTILRVDPRTLEVVRELPIPTRLDLHSIFGDPSGQLITLGANFVTPERGVALTRRLTSDD